MNEVIDKPNLMTSLNLTIEALPSSHETGKLQIKHLKRFWYSSLLKRENKLADKGVNEEWQTDKTMLAVLGLGLEQLIKYLYNTAPSFEEFEDWIIDTAGEPDPDIVKRFNDLFSFEINISNDPPAPFFSPEEMSIWKYNGYIIVKDAVPREDCDATIQVICDFLSIDRDDPNTWYNPHPARQGIMVQLFQHPILQKNRNSAYIRHAYEHLWQRKDIWLNTDRVGFNPPETPTWQFPGPDLHWDVSLDLPIPFGLQGILYLADTEANQGAFTLVPGFQNWGEKWLRSLPEEVNPRRENLHALGSLPVTANAGDFIIWHQALPHGSSPNRSTKPRFVQYINMEPANLKENDRWI